MTITVTLDEKIEKLDEHITLGVETDPLELRKLKKLRHRLLQQKSDEDDYATRYEQLRNVEALDKLKARRIREIRDCTEELIVQGFAYDSQTFALGEADQIKYNALKTLESLLTWPVDLSTMSNTAYSLAQANLDAFLGMALTVVKGHKDSGRALRVAIEAAADKAAVDAIVDNR